ncbi:restriction endonuclease subunit S [Lacticaseibacillus rhamnosus]|uniref:restriction endonuclease subunit S n=2 Tax=Lacticaseibacillus rhamnosus TaxID=47715 RepID=UPI001CDB8F26|nr:restriction endonuclease subunit S [Lacticaseibacillus rhamnosus]
MSDYLHESLEPGSNGAVAKKLTVKLWGKGVVPKKDIYKGSKKTKYYLRSANQIIYGKLDFLHAAFGIIPKALEGWESTIDSPAFDVDTTKGNVQFLLFLFLRPKFYLREGSRANGSRKAKRIHEDVFLNIKISIPQLSEQNRIAENINAVNELIAATQDKLEKLSVLQRGFLQHFFAQTWRFSGYSHAWEYYRLGDVATRVRGNDGRMNLPILTISAGKGWLTQEQRFSQNIAGNELKKYTLLSKGELSYNHGNSKLAEYGAVFVLKQFKEALVPRVYHSFNVSGKADPDFIEYLFESGVPNHELRKLISSGARMDGLLNINYDSFMNISVRLPSIEEQNKIARVLEKLKKLTDETRLRLFNLQQAKKSLLRMLFP